MKIFIASGFLVTVLCACSNYQSDVDHVSEQKTDKQAQDTLHECLPLRAKELVGRTDLSEQQIKQITNSEIIRYAKVGEAVTEDYRPNRITIISDSNTQKIIDASCG
ncbi:I78 family peptidase inhibitor [Acinetobacter radioresistens]|uniref:I78 family peptidase inhibitor n=1 Tax=Acinetobacter radioresistens TaxID=40216 RepID=UPI002003EB23|nr:I78 family peptidase inhibitor [Acinetobacter radioresistens]MCK4100835.1 hypothetical protein [Acinetobacter radioresistens]